MGKRVFSSTLLWGIVIATMWFFRTGGAIVLGTIVSMLTLREFYRLMQGCGYTPFVNLGTAMGGVVTLAPWIERHVAWLPAHLLLPAAAVVFSLRLLGERTPEHRVDALASTLFGLVYVALLLQYFIRLLLPDPAQPIGANGRLLLCLWVIAATKFCDMGALLTGLAIGRHKMSPQISPKKTWEGAAGGIVASMGIGAALAWFGQTQGIVPAGLTPWVGAAMALPLALLGIVGDLVESILKRRANLKDSASIIPAQGGFFDMSDSLILTAPVGYFMLHLLR